MEDKDQQSFPLMPLAAQKIRRKEVPGRSLKAGEEGFSHRFQR